MTFEIKVLGSEPAWPSALRACSGFLVRTPSSVVLIDCGTGVFERLRDTFVPEDLTAVVISHLHFDHWVDLLPFRYYLNYEACPEVPPALYLPPHAGEKLQMIAEQIDPGEGFFSEVFRTSEYDPQGELLVEDLRITFHKTRHPIDTYAFRLVVDDKTVVYSSDTGWDESAAEFARGADLFICDANWGTEEGHAHMHLSAAEAGRLAAQAGVERLLLNHLAEPQAKAAVRAAREEYSGPLEYAAAGHIYRV